VPIETCPLRRRQKFVGIDAAHREASGGDWHDALPAAAAVELLHNFSLIHDDIEDGDSLRRGRPTLWKVWGIPQAINAGDALYTLAHTALNRLTAYHVPIERILAARRRFDRACIALTQGQHLDLGLSRNRASPAEYLRRSGGQARPIEAACGPAHWSPQRRRITRPSGVDSAWPFGSKMMCWASGAIRW
jgi:hypothetical protein